MNSSDLGLEEWLLLGDFFNSKSVHSFDNEGQFALHSALHASNFGKNTIAEESRLVVPEVLSGGIGTGYQALSIGTE